MPAVEGAQSQTQTQGSEGNRGSYHGRPRGHGGRSRGPSHGSSMRGPIRATYGSAPPARGTTINQNTAPEDSAQGSGTKAGRGGRGRSAPNQSRRGGSHRGHPGQAATQSAARRAFGGRLTACESSGSAEAAQIVPSLSADAPEFVPGEPVAVRSVPKASRRAEVKQAKSSATDLPTRIHEDISTGNYECAICTDDVLRTSQIWSCSICWTVVHAKCVKRWYQNQMKQVDSQSPTSRGELSWRCPGCNSRLSDDPGLYHCWCGKDINPKPANVSLPPHSCGQTCSKPRSTCPHPCSLQCHAGPCPPCGLVGPTQSCYCGKNSSQKLCRETDYEHGWSCQEICDDLLPCGEHFCPRPCHSGVCGECDLKVDAKCFCGRLEKQVPCFERDSPQNSFDVAKEVWFEGSFSCEQDCKREFDCGLHKCFVTCHPQDEGDAHCPYSPDLVTHCPCGKTSLEKLSESPRSSCQDPIPHCLEVCGKALPCGHSCSSKCHTGDCGMCLETIDISCRCGRTSSKSKCHQGTMELPMCMKICQATLNCGRHKCGDHCCSGEKRAAERQAARRKHRVTGDNMTVEAEHICIRICGRPLKCGNHDCQQICHRGPCASCPEAVFSEVSCACGRTVLQPPQPCGTRAPECRFPCLQQPSCGHPPVDHTCHPDDVACPKCPFLVEKLCACGKEKLPNQPCHLQKPHCGRVCGKKLNCGLHNCKKLCHRSGDCEDVGQDSKHCNQVCGKTKMFCEHTCQNRCHGQTLCNESVACTAKAIIYCPCGLRKQEVKCSACSSNPEPHRPEVKCDDECLRLERNRRLAAALNIDPSSHTNDHVPYSDITMRLFEENRNWCEAQEREFRVFAASSNEIRMRYKPMPSTQRQFLHSLAEDYGLESRSEDSEPFRYVLVYKGSRFVSAPTKTLAQCAKIRATQAAAALTVLRPPSPPVAPAVEPFNAFLLTLPRFGLTIEDVRSAVATDLAQQPALHFNIEFLPSEEVLLHATVSYSSFLSPAAVATALTRLKAHVAETIRRLDIAGNILLCHVDAAKHIQRREDMVRQDTSGWSAVASRAAFKRESPVPEDSPALGTGRRLIGLKKKKVVEKEQLQPWASKLDGDVEC